MTPANPTFIAEALRHWPPRRKRAAPEAQAKPSRSPNDGTAAAIAGTASTDQRPGVIRRMARALLHGLYHARMRQAQREIALMHLRLGEDHPTVQAYRAALQRATRS